MADDTRGPGNGLLYALLGALCVVVAAGGYYIYLNSQDLLSVSQAAPPAAPAAPPAPAPAPAPAPQQAAPAGPSANQLAQAQRRLPTPGRWRAREFTGAESAAGRDEVPAWPRPRTPARNRRPADDALARPRDRGDRGRTPRASPPVETARAHSPRDTAPPTALAKRAHRRPRSRRGPDAHELLEAAAVRTTGRPQRLFCQEKATRFPIGGQSTFLTRGKLRQTRRFRLARVDRRRWSWRGLCRQRWTARCYHCVEAAVAQPVLATMRRARAELAMPV